MGYVLRKHKLRAIISGGRVCFNNIITVYCAYKPTIMKKLLLLVALLSVVHVSAQSKFIIDGKISTVANGKAILIKTVPVGFYPFKTNTDSVPIRNHTFTFTGMLKYPEQYRIQFFEGKKRNMITEPFFVSAGRHPLTIKESMNPHDSLEVGVGVEMPNEAANDEYIKKYLPGYNKIANRFEEYEKAVEKCNGIKNKKEKAGCDVAAQAVKESIRKNVNDNLQAYTKANPRSPILPWLLYDYIRYRGYYDAYASVFTQIAPYHTADMNTAISSFLATQKQVAPGYTFALKDLVQAQLPKKNMPPKRYILVDFWYSSCGPCLAQFKDLKKIYSKFSKKGLEIVTVSVDDKNTMAAYNKVLAKNKFPWLQALDPGGAKSRPMGVSMYPTGFLLDSQWKIVKTHIDPVRLDSFLEANLL